MQKEGILNKREYLGPVWPADVSQPMTFSFVQYSLIHDLVLTLLLHSEDTMKVVECTITKTIIKSLCSRKTLDTKRRQSHLATSAMTSGGIVSSFTNFQHC